MSESIRTCAGQLLRWINTIEALCCNLGRVAHRAAQKSSLKLAAAVRSSYLA